MGPLSLSEFEGVQISKLDSSHDFRGTFLKFEPRKLLHDEIGAVAVSINPMIGTVRGLHFQIEPHAEEKIVSCLQGSVFDVIVDIRRSSKTFGRWSSIELNAKNGLQVCLPKGIAHGFQVLQSNSIVHYCLTSVYSKAEAFSINPFGDLSIKWPLKSSAISDKDTNGLEFSEAVLKYSASLENL
jgi:dTDP-4-dehydrorhamnose 3,5-epimerase